MGKYLSLRKKEKKSVIAIKNNLQKIIESIQLFCNASERDELKVLKISPIFD